MATPNPETGRSYGCSFGCGNPYDVILISVRGGDTLFLCMPCYIRQSADMLAAMVDKDDPLVRQMVALAEMPGQAPMIPGHVKKRGHNAPVNAEDDDLIAAYDDVVTPDELSEEFR